MPGKQVTCCICGEMLSKRQTYATGEKDDDGNPKRACKTHEGVSEKAKDMQKEAVKKVVDSVEEKNRKQRDGWAPSGDSDSDSGGFGLNKKYLIWMDTHCWCCGEEGISLREAMQLRMIAIEKMKIEGKTWNPFVYEESEIPVVKKLLGNNRVLVRFALNDEMFELYKKWFARMKPKARDAISFGRLIQLCAECQEATGIKPDMDKLFPKVNISAMGVLGALYQTSDLKKSIQKVAQSIVHKEEHDRVKGN